MGKAAKEVVFGYVQMDILAQMLKFRKWSTHPLNNAQVMKLFLSFNALGCNCFSLKHFLPIVVKWEYCVADSYSEDTELEESLPQLVLNEVVTPTKYVVYVLSGQHWVHALERWVGQQKSKLVKVKQEAKVIEDTKIGMLDEEQCEYYNHKLKDLWDQLQLMVSLGGQWGVILFDEGEQSFVYEMCNRESSQNAYTMC